MPRFRTRLAQIQALLLTQRSLRLLLRSAWLFAAGYLIGWSAQRLFGSPDPIGWYAIGALLAAPAWISIFRPLRRGPLVWKMDRRLQLKEQITTAWQLRSTPPGDSLARLLIADATQILPQQSRRILKRGWFLSRDLVSTLIVVVLLLTVFWATAFTNTLAAAAGDGQLQLPPLVEDPNADDVFPSGIPGLTGQPGDAGPDDSSSSPDGPGDLGALDDILSELGEGLGEEEETAAAGEALEQGDLESAAQEFENLADQADQLPQDAQDNLQESLEQAAEQAEQQGFDQLAQDLSDAAEALENPPDSVEAADALDQVAEDLRDLEQQIAAMGQEPADEEGQAPQDEPQVGSGSGTSGAGTGEGGDPVPPEPVTRIQGEGDDFELDGGDNPSGLLVPGDPGAESTADSGSPASQGSPVAQDSGVVDTILTPYSYPWKWRDVVSDYFTPPR
jgi:hypothetical protein